MLNKVSTYNFQINKGTDYYFSIRFQDCNGEEISLRGFQVTMHIRRNYLSNLIDELSIENKRIVSTSFENDGMMDTLEFSFPHEVTKKYPVGTLLYDLQIRSTDAQISKILEGHIQCQASITQ